MVEGYVSRRDHRRDWIWRELHYRPFVLDVFRHGEREVVETVILVIFPFDFLEERPGVQPERERSQSCSFGVRKFRMLLKVNTKSLCLQSRFAVKWVLNTDRGFKAASCSFCSFLQLPAQYYFEV